MTDEITAVDLVFALVRAEVEVCDRMTKKTDAAEKKAAKNLFVALTGKKPTPKQLWAMTHF